MHVPTEHNNHPSSDVLSVIITVRVIVLPIGACIPIIIQINISALLNVESCCRSMEKKE